MWIASALVVGCIGASACERSPRGRGGGPGAQPDELRRVAGVLAGARCARAEVCRELESGGQYPDREACLLDQQLVFQQELNMTACSRGVDGEKLDQCLQAIRYDDCDPPAPFGPLAACRSHELCVK